MDTRTQGKQVVGFLATMGAELDEIEKSGIEHCFGTVDESALILKAQLSYTRQIAGMWRRLALEWVGRTMDLIPHRSIQEEKA
jgi:hypothetical protein